MKTIYIRHLALILLAATLVAAPKVSAQLVASVLPTSRSVQIGTGPATVFGTIINAGTQAATNCAIRLITKIPAKFDFQTTDPTTNGLVGAINTPANIAPGTFQTYVLVFTPSLAFAPTEVELEFDCDNTDPVARLPGINTLILSASNAPVPDVIALAGTPPPPGATLGDGISRIPDENGIGIFSVATVNVGATGELTVTADTGNETVPVNVFLCETNPASGSCINPSVPTASPVTSTIMAGATPTFGAFVQGTGETVAADAAKNRVYLRYKTNASGPFDDFTSPRIDSAKWANLEFVRRVRGGRLESEIGRLSSNGSNSLNFSDPNAVNRITADVTITEVSNAGANPKARLGGFFYNSMFSDGVANFNDTGEVFAAIEISGRNFSDGQSADLLVDANIFECTNADCTEGNEILFDSTIFTAVQLGQAHRAGISWDPVARRFTFEFDAQTFSFDPTTAAPVMGASKDPFKGIGTRVSGISDAGEGGFVAARFDNVEVNGLPYDDFASDRIDRTRWSNVEFVRHIDNGQFQVEQTRFGSNGGNTQNFADVDNVDGFRADVTVTEVDNSDARVRARLTGYFYNTGLPGVDQAGEVQAEIQIRQQDNAFAVAYFISRCDNDPCNAFTDLVFDDTTFGPVALGETHTLSINFDGERFTFGFDSQTAAFDPRSVAPVAMPSQYFKRTGFRFKGIGTRVNAIDNVNEGAHVKATFDNVEIIRGTVTRGSTSVAVQTE